MAKRPKACRIRTLLLLNKVSLFSVIKFINFREFSIVIEWKNFSACFEQLCRKYFENLNAYICRVGEKDESKSILISDQLLDVRQIIKVN